ncbi:MAG: HAD family hydrolase [Thaumarchaeota archaeon]|nr:HAD family hydrolase [Candidatus Calditenuaceae archaeon]MDW8186513.1 HAD family hydrolase [Nitrososphaerota archaeon]
MAEIMNYAKVSGALVALRSLERLKEVDAVIFDCDGVLIDVRGSYDRAIIESVRTVLERSMGIEVPETSLDISVVYRLRSTGGFNNDVDTAWVMLLWLFSGSETTLARELGEVLERALERSEGPDELLRTVELEMMRRRSHAKRLGRFNPIPIEDAILSVTGDRQKHVSREMLERVFGEEARDKGIGEEYELFKRFIGTGRVYGRDLLETVFDDLYYGPMVVRELFGRGPYFELGKGLFQNETPLVDEAMLLKLKEQLGIGGLGMVTGRERYTTALVLNEVMGLFNERACVFLSDESRSGLGEVVSKPSPYGLIKSVVALGDVREVLYVGNSAEDLYMCSYAESYGVRPLFAGIIGLSEDPDSARREFIELKADVIAHDVRELVSLMEVVKARSSSTSS